MARKSTQATRASRTTKSTRGRKPTARKASSTTSTARSFNLKNINKADVKRVMRKIGNNSLALYLAGGVGALFLGRFAYRYYRNHPEIQEFIRENFDSVENSLREYRGDSDVDTAEARH